MHHSEYLEHSISGSLRDDYSRQHEAIHARAIKTRHKEPNIYADISWRNDNATTATITNQVFHYDQTDSSALSTENTTRNFILSDVQPCDDF